MKICRPTILLLFIFAAACKKNVDAPKPVTVKSPVTPIVVVLGSSTAAGVGATPTDSCWADKVQTEITAINSKALLYNLAVEGYTTYQAMPTGFSTANRPGPDTARNITKALSYKPNLVLISFPSNDISDGYSNSEIVRNYNVITQKLDSAKIAYIIFSTQPRDFTAESERLRLNTLNDTVMSVFPNNVNNFLDTLSTSTFEIKPTYDSGDGIHLNDAGHTIIYNYTQVQPIFKSFLQSCK